MFVRAQCCSYLLFLLLLVASFEASAQSISLDDLWKFHIGDDLEWASAKYDDSGWADRQLKEPWPDDGFPDGHQYAWYRIKVNATDLLDLQIIGLRLGFIRNAYEVYVNGEKLGGVGRLPPNHVVNYDRIRIFPLLGSAVNEDGKILIALRVWGGSQLAVTTAGAGPYGGDFKLGDYTDLLQELNQEQMPLLIFSCMFLVIGAYFLYLFFRTPTFPPFFWFGITSVILAIYLTTQTQWKYSLGLPFVFLEKIEAAGIFLFLASLAQMIWSVLDRPANWILRVYQAYFIGLTIVVCFVPGLDIHYWIRPYWQFGSITSLIPIVYAVYAAVRAGNTDARTLVFGLTFFVLTALNDLMINVLNLNSVRVMSLGFLAVAGSMAVILANKFSNLIHGLESEVLQRTAEFEKVNNLLTKANLSLQEMTRIDPLTGLLNRRGFEAEAEIERQRYIRQGEPLGILIADVDHFKSFNDEHGHACGDLVLCDVAELLKTQTRDIDRAARWGGEEFVVMLPGTDLEGVRKIAEKMRERVERHRVEFEGQRLGVTMTVGGAVYQKGESIDDCIARADEALYQGKKNGRNRVEVSPVQL